MKVTKLPASAKSVTIQTRKISDLLERECMVSSGDRILLVEHDSDISDLIARQALRSVGYQVDVVADSSSAIQYAVRTPPDLIIANLNLPGLSAKDLLVALSSQGV